MRLHKTNANCYYVSAFDYAQGSSMSYRCLCSEDCDAVKCTDWLNLSQKIQVLQSGPHFQNKTKTFIYSSILLDQLVLQVICHFRLYICCI